jgi:hypothetical protein
MVERPASPDAGHMTSEHSPDPTRADGSLPTLLLVALVAVVALVVAVVGVATTGAAWAVVAAMLLLLVGLSAVARTMTRQMADDD